MKTELIDTGERMVPFYHKGKLIYAEHMNRYNAAVNIVKGKTVLDIASGSGYGTKLLAEAAKYVYGVDIEEDAISYAKKEYNAANIEYIIGNGEAIPLEDNSVDVVITLETIEHIKDYKKFISEIKRVLKPDGLAIISTPNDLEFAEGNHFHLHEFVYEELTKLIELNFKHHVPYFQTTWKVAGMVTSTQMSNEGKLELDVINYAPLEKNKALYFYVLCSNRKIVEIPDATLALGEHYSERQALDDILKKQELTEKYEGLLDQQNKLRTHAEEMKTEIEKLRSYAQSLEQEVKEIKQSKIYKISKKIPSKKI